MKRSIRVLNTVLAVGFEAFEIRARKLGAPVPAELDRARSCGSCRACCSALGIGRSPGEELLGLIPVESDSGSPCPHECIHGCQIYGRHPISCQLYACWWRRGWSEEEDRPDRLGVIVDDSANDETLEIGEPLCIASEVRPGVFAPKGAPLEDQPKVIQELAKDRLVLMRYWADGHPSTVYGSEERIRSLHAAERRLGYRK